MMLCAKNDFEIKLFISRGHSINYQDSLGTSALHKAVSSGKNELVRDLLKNGANPNLCNFQGHSPIFYVKNKECIDILLEYGHADVLNIIDKNNISSMVFNKIVKDYIEKLVKY
jgi:ankyrin repeat protein